VIVSGLYFIPGVYLYTQLSLGSDVLNPLDILNIDV